MVSCINYILLVGESGTGKSPVRREASTVSPPASAELQSSAELQTPPSPDVPQ